MTRQQAETILQYTFKLPKFYDKQWETIERILNGERVLLIEKTGFGKSLCFQFPAIIFQGTTIIFSPLIALMRDQVKKLTALGIPARCINSEQTQEENSYIINEAKQGKIKILYIAPERQENNEWISATREMNLSMVVVDEAHCISTWGHDFRPAFRRIINLVKLLPQGLPVLATTATATKKVELDVAQQIGNINVIRGNLMRDNFKLFVIKVNSEEEKLIWLGKYLNRLPGSGIIYTGTRVDTEIYSNWFESLQIPTIAYHAGIEAETRITIENGLLSNKWKGIISTNALGMGIDKPDIRFIIHTQILQSPIHYYQEIGRAGRDGQTAFIILFYNPADSELPKAFIDNSRPPLKNYHKVVNAIREEMLTERELILKLNQKQTQIRVIKADLIEQGIIRQLSNRKLEYVLNAPELKTDEFEALRNSKLDDLEKMIDYVGTTDSRMKFLCDYLGDNSNQEFHNCDNTGEMKMMVKVTPEWIDKLLNFRLDYYPLLKVESKGSNIINGVAGSYYGFSNVGTAIHNSKYENGGDFPDFLLDLVIKAFRNKFGQERFDLVLYVPQTKSGDLVRNFAEKTAQTLKFPISHNLHKIRQTDEQKVFENTFLKTSNVKGAFTYEFPDEINGKSVLLIDDIFDSGATMKELGRLLTGLGATKIVPLVIARTVGGDKV